MNSFIKFECKSSKSELYSRLGFKWNFGQVSNIKKINETNVQIKNLNF